MGRALAAVALAMISAGCASHGKGEPAAGGSPDWRQIATEPDRKRLRDWRSAWTAALTRARGAGHGAAIAREGALLDPDAAAKAEWREPPVGDYQCRTIKIGAKGPGNLDYIAYPPFTCRIETRGSALRLAKLTGSQRPIGHLLPQGPQRMVFLGTLQLGDERRALDYGHDRDRDMAGLVERIGERRWRLVLPYPAFESMIDVVELVPAS